MNFLKVKPFSIYIHQLLGQTWNTGLFCTIHHQDSRWKPLERPKRVSVCEMRLTPLQYTTKLDANPLNPAYSCVPISTQISGETKNSPTFWHSHKTPLNSANINLDLIIATCLSAVPPWQLNLPKVDFSLTKYAKSDTNGAVFNRNMVFSDRNMIHINLFSPMDLRMEIKFLVPQHHWIQKYHSQTSCSMFYFTTEAKAILTNVEYIRRSQLNNYPPEKTFCGGY